MNVLPRRREGGLAVALLAWTVACLPAETSIGAQELPGDRARLEAALVKLDSGEVPLDELTSIPAAAQSPALTELIEDLTQTRDEVGALRGRYTDTYPPIREGLATITRIEQVEIPSVVRDLIASLPEQGESADLPNAGGAAQQGYSGSPADTPPDNDGMQRADSDPEASSGTVGPSPAPKVRQCSDVLFYDGFESGDFSGAIGGTWNQTGNRRGSNGPSPDTVYAGSGAWRMTHFEAPPKGDSDATLWGNIENGRNEVWMSWMQRIPDNYSHRWGNEVGGANNKFVIIGYERARLHGGWSTDGWHFRVETGPSFEGNDTEHGLPSMTQPYVSDGDSGALRQTWGGPWQFPLIRAEDRGQWVEFGLYVKLATSVEASDGVVELYRNGDLVTGRNKLPLGVFAANTPPPPIAAFELGGWANSGYTERTHFYVDEVIVCGAPLTFGPA